MSEGWVLDSPVSGAARPSGHDLRAMASKKIADGSLGTAASSGGAAALSAVRRASVATNVVRRVSAVRASQRVGFLRKTYQQARATIIAAPAKDYQGSNDSEKEESEDNSEVKALPVESRSVSKNKLEVGVASRSNSKKKTEVEAFPVGSRSNSKEKAPSKWKMAQSMKTGAGKALNHRNDILQKIRLTAQAAFEHNRLQQEMIQALSVALCADLENACPGISDLIENILHDITDAKVKDRAQVAERVLNLIMTPDQAAALQKLRDCLIVQLEDDRSTGDELETIYEKLKARVNTMRTDFPEIAALQAMPERHFSKRRNILIEFNEPVQADEAHANLVEPSAPISEPKPKEEATHTAGSGAGQPGRQSSQPTSLVMAAPTRQYRTVRGYQDPPPAHPVEEKKNHRTEKGSTDVCQYDR